MAVAQCPASCGELIQGWILDSEKLISCPIDWYSTVEVRSGAPLADERPLSRAMINQVLALFHYPVKMSQSLRLEIHSTIPIAKGMASSTADIAATAVATAHHLGHTLDEATLAKLCVALEPTDSTIFRQLTLFDHNDASTQEACAAQPKIDVLVLESPETLRTEDYHRTPRRAGLLAGAPMLKQAWEKVRLACASHDPILLGEAATLSAIASQPLLPKPHFSTLLDVAEACDLYGINVAHSGSVVGLLLDRRKHDVEQVRWHLGKKHLTAHWPEQHLLTMVEGGVTLL
ncbi:MAG: L-threonine kinase [Yokenella regensburgei]|nr:L-threonine kinase [Yokenella regensburgei]